MYVHGWRLKLYASPSISSKKKRIIQIFSCASNVDMRGYPIRFVAAALTLCLPLGSFDAFLSFSIRCRSNQAIATTHDSRWLDIDRTTFGNVFDLYSSLFLSFLPSFLLSPPRSLLLNHFSLCISPEALPRVLFLALWHATRPVSCYLSMTVHGTVALAATATV